MTSSYRRGSMVVVDYQPNIRIITSHTPADSMVVQGADRRDLLLALMLAEGIEPEIIRLVNPQPGNEPIECRSLACTLDNCRCSQPVAQGARVSPME